MRLDKFLAENGLGSRAQVKQFLKKGLVLVNGRAEKSPKTQIDETADEIAVSGQRLTYEKFVYYLLNKPQGVISATEDDRHKTVLDLLDETARQKEVFPVGRLDIDTHGLLLLNLPSSSGRPDEPSRCRALCCRNRTESLHLSASSAQDFRAG